MLFRSQGFMHAKHVFSSFFLSLFVFLLLLLLLLLLFFLRQSFSVYPWLSWNSLCRQAGLELRNPPASASQVLGLKACATTPGSEVLLLLRLVFFYSGILTHSSNLVVVFSLFFPFPFLLIFNRESV